MSYRRLALGASIGAAAIFSMSASAQTVATPAPSTPPAAAAAMPAPPPPAEIEIGRIAPDFTLQVSDSLGASKAMKLSDLRGKVVVLAFYPADRSSGCTAELTKFRDEYTKMFGAGTVVVPISGDTPESHASWSHDMKFPFVLGADPGLVVAKQYGSSNPARAYASRTVFVIGKDGKILWRNLKFPALNEAAYTELAGEVAKAQ
jgi:peroxiredoxin Q/BCP